jgi:hypothetical protein
MRHSSDGHLAAAIAQALLIALTAADLPGSIAQTKPDMQGSSLILFAVKRYDVMRRRD